MNRERIISLIWMAFAAYVWIEASSWPQSFLDVVGPAAYPKLLAGMIFVGAALLFITSKSEKVKPIKGKRDFNSFVKVLCCLIVYLLIFEKLGFVLSSILFLMAICCFFDGRPVKEMIKGAVLFSVGFSVVLYIFFAKFLGILLPHLFW